MAVRRKLRAKVIAGVVTVLYLVTWFGGCERYSLDLRAKDHDWYHACEERNAKSIQEAALTGEGPYLIELYPEGPQTRVNWCVPVLPGLLLVDSDSVIGPMAGNGGAKLVLYYGAGTRKLALLWGWMA
jgi:hypothetical protein